MSFKVSRRAKSILASLLITSNFVNSKINAMESQSGQNQNQNTYQQQEKPWWQIRGEQAVANEENLLFDGLIVDPNYLCWILNNTVNYCQNVYDTAKEKNIKLLPDFTGIKEKINKNKFEYNKILSFSEIKEDTKEVIFGCLIVTAHLMKQLTGIYAKNAEMGSTFAVNGKVRMFHSCILVPCTDGQLLVLNVFRDSDTNEFFPYIMPLLEYADKHMSYHLSTKTNCGSNNSVGLYVRCLLNSIIKSYTSKFDFVKLLTKTIDDIDQKGDFQLQPYVYMLQINYKEFCCEPDDLSGDRRFVYSFFYLISDDDRIGDYSKYDMSVWNAAKNLDGIATKEYWENFLKLAEAFPQSKILIACPNAFEPKVGDKVTKLATKGREAIKNLGASGDGKVFQRVLSLKEFLDIKSKYDSELQKLLEAKNYNFS